MALLTGRARLATLDELMAATGWRPHFRPRLPRRALKNAARSHRALGEDQLGRVSRAELRAAWNRLVRTTPPNVSAGLLRLAIAHKLQSKAMGGVTKAMERRLQEIAGRRAVERVTPGTRYVREWRGRIHVVTVSDEGRYRWDDRIGTVSQRLPGPSQAPSGRGQHSSAPSPASVPNEPPALCNLYQKIERGRSRPRLRTVNAQHEACVAYIKSQASEGWKLVRERYDDGGISGGTLNRPALKRLLADIARRAHRHRGRLQSRPVNSIAARLRKAG